MTTRSNYRSWDASYATLTVPPSCATAAALSVGYTCANNNGAATIALPEPSCFPWGVPSVLSSDYTFYSPATACPSGYNYEASRTRTTGLTVPRSAAEQDQWLDGETAVYCCPDGYAWSDVAGHCRLSYGGVYVNVNCTDDGDVSTMTLSEVGDPVRAMAPAVQLRFQESDGAFVPPRSVEAVTTRVGGGGSITGGARETGPRESGAAVESTGARPTGGVMGKAVKGKGVVGLVVSALVVGMVFQ